MKHVATNLNVAKFSKPQLEMAIKELPRLSVGEIGTRRLPHVLADLGVRFVIVEPLPNTRIDGAAVWLDDKSPVIAVSLRYDRVDGFWFTLMHELAHTLEGDGRRMAWLDDALVGKDAEPTEGKSDPEVRADKRAIEWLIPEHAFEAFMLRARPYFSRHTLLSFANEVGVHPAIVVGRLQHMGVVPWTHHRNLLSKIRHVFTMERSTGA